MKNRVKWASLILLIHQVIFCQKVEPLSIGTKISKIIEAKGKHDFSVELRKGEFALLNLRQRNADVKIITYDPDGNHIEEFDSLNGSTGDELILIEAYQDGKYVLQVTPFEKRLKRGGYTMELLSVEQDVIRHLDQVLDNLAGREHLPGFAVNILEKDTCRYHYSNGYARLANQIPYTNRTVQNIASISKTFIGISLMLLVEEGKLTLDTPINNILPFDVTNPYFPEKSITIRHLANHTATINDFPVYYKKAGVLVKKPLMDFSRYPRQVQKTIKMAMGNIELSMAAFLREMLTTEGGWYKKKNFLKHSPGSEWFYSNVGASLAAYIVELTSGIPYDEFVRRRIWRPLGLHSAAWKASESDSVRRAYTYTQGTTELPRYRLITYPDGQVHINSDDLGRYLMELIKGFSGHGTILSNASFHEMMKVQHEQKEGKFKGRKDGIFWEFGKNGLMGHSGGDTGVSAFMYFDPKTLLGFTFMTNTMPSESDGASVQSKKIWSVLKRYGKYLN